MTHSNDQSTPEKSGPAPRTILWMLAAFVTTLIAVAWMVRSVDHFTRQSLNGDSADLGSVERGSSQAVRPNGARGRAEEATRNGVRARITSLHRTSAVGTNPPTVAERSLPTMAFALQVGESLDSRIAPGPFRAEFRVPFSTNLSREAQLGVEFQGGKFIMRRRGEVILSDATGSEPRTSMTTLPIRLLVENDAIEIWFESDGSQPCRLRALWQPVEALSPLPLPALSSSLLLDEPLRGMAFVQQARCAACHRSSETPLQSQLTAHKAPMLGDVGRRLQPEWIRAWLADPQKIRRGSLMPKLPLSDDELDDLTHYLVSLGGPAALPSGAPPNADLVTTGMVAYHTVGCFSCHGALESVDRLPGGRPSSSLRSLRQYQSLGRPAQKSDLNVLADFLRDPLKHWPDGRMPSLNLSPLEGQAIAAYLVAHDQQNNEQVDRKRGSFQLAPERVDRGRAIFASSGCANCHELGPDRTPVVATLRASSLESLGRSNLNIGCLSPAASVATPWFSSTVAQRRGVQAFLGGLDDRVTDSVPHDRLALDFSRLNCAACHVFHRESGPDAAIGQYFIAIEEADLGDEGRLPPNLSYVGSKLNPQWMNDVLAHAAQARPYLGARMPQFGERNVQDMGSSLAAAAGVWSVPDHGPATTSDDAENGRHLVGAGAMNCIQCHGVGGRPSTGTPGPDLAHMAERLRYEAFTRWLYDPRLTRPGTRMPSFFVNGRSAFTDVHEGDANHQVQAIWAYLSLGEFMPPPDGLVDPSTMALQVIDDPVVFRSFIKGAGVRAIAVGYPEQIHLAYDPEQCRLAAVWEGEFVNAAGAWANRGGTETNPSAVAWSGPKESVFISASMPGQSSSEAKPKFRGYRLDDQRRPVFMYELSAGEIELVVEEQPVPKRVDGRPSLTQRFTLAGPVGARVILSVGSRRAVGLSGDASDGVASVTIDETGQARFELEVTW